MKKQEAVNLYSNLNKLGKLTGVKFAYAVSKNLNILKSEIESLEKASKPSEKYIEFDKERVELAKKYAKKDEKGKPLSENNAFVMEDQEAFEKEFNELKEKNKDLVEEREKQMNEYVELLKTEANITLHKIALVDVPQNITVEQMYAIGEIVDDSEKK
jgi:hypothetical protein